MTNKSDKLNSVVSLTVNNQMITAPPGNTVVQALWHCGKARIKGIGCIEGVCGSCRVLVRRHASSSVTTELACQTTIEENMQVIFPPLSRPIPHQYQLTEITNERDLYAQFKQIFPEAQHCRHCGGCNISCPKDIDVEQGVRFATDGNFKEAGALFFTCVMCDLCSDACPELIAPNYVGLFSRRVYTCLHMKPANLLQRIDQLNRDEMDVVLPKNTGTIKDQ